MPKPERIVVDTTILFSAMLYDGMERRALKRPIQWISTDYNAAELKRVLQEKRRFSPQEAEELVHMLAVTFLPAEVYEGHIVEADALIGHRDKKDVPVVALALAMPNDGIWSSDKHFDELASIRIWTAREIIEMTSES